MAIGEPKRPNACSPSNEVNDSMDEPNAKKYATGNCSFSYWIDNWPVPDMQTFCVPLLPGEKDKQQVRIEMICIISSHLLVFCSIGGLNMRRREIDQ
jgi:hypothetical protein